MYGFTVEELLVGKYYRTSRNRNRDGIIVEATRKDVYGADNTFAIRVREQQAPWGEFWATVFVAED